jgi:hypothetical protein
MWSCLLYQAEKQEFGYMYISCLSSANIRKLFLSNQKKLLFLHEFAEYYCKKHKLLVFKFVSPKHINKRNDEKTRKINLKNRYGKS